MLWSSVVEYFLVFCIESQRREFRKLNNFELNDKTFVEKKKFNKIPMSIGDFGFN